MQYKLNLKRDIPDPRDLRLKKPFLRLPFKKEVDLREKMPPVSDQGELGSCTAHAVVDGLVEFAQRSKKITSNYSRLFLYYETRKRNNETAQDSGASLRDALKALADKGVCKEDIWPYNIANFAKKPPSSCYTMKNYKPTKYYRLLTVNDMLSCLKDGYPFVCGIEVFAQIDVVTAAKPYIALPKRGESSEGGHAIAIVGLKLIDNEWMWIMRNSWGISWGIHGCGYLPWSYLTNSNLAFDFWTLR